MAVTLAGLRRHRRRAVVEATRKPTIIQRITKQHIRRMTVKYAAYPTRLTGPERDRIRVWMLGVLADKGLNGTAFPVPARPIYMYNDGYPTKLTGGTWEDGRTRGTDDFYLAGASMNIPPLERVAVLATIARLTQLHDDPEIQVAVAEAMVRNIKDTITPVWDGLVVATERPAQMAFNMATYEVAAELDGKWFLPSGQPVKVDDKWTVMDF